MTLPLQRMSTAPRTGEKVWCLFATSPTMMVRVTWDQVEDGWHNGKGCYYPTDDFSGWLDIEALVRDGERLTKLIDIADRLHGDGVQHLFEKAYGLACEAGDAETNDYQRWVRAAIDKEMGRG